MKSSFIFLLSLLVLCPPGASAQWVQTNGPYGGGVHCLAVSGGKLLAGTAGGIFVSSNAGAEWLSLNGTAFMMNKPVFMAAAFGFTIFADYYDDLLRSSDDGITWQWVNGGLPHPSSVGCMVASDSNLFAGTAKGVFFSSDCGEKWSPINDGLTNLSIEVLALKESTLFAGTDDGVFRSTTHGKSWVAVNNGLTHPYVTSLAVGDTDMFVSMWGSVYRSTNRGESWSAVNSGLPVYISPLTLAVRGNIILVGTEQFLTEAIYASTDRGEHWTNASNGIPPDVRVTSLVVQGSDFYAGTSGCGVYRSRNNGTTWTPVNAGLRSTSVLSFAAGQTGLYAGTNGSGVFRSTDDGISWTDANSGLTSLTVPSLACIDTIVFAGTWYSGGVFRSPDRAQSWTAVNNGFPNNSPAFSLLSLGSKLYAGTLDGAYISTNRGTNWSASRTGIPEMTSIQGLAGYGSNLLASGQSGGVFSSSNSGADWTVANNGLTDTRVWSLAGHGDTLFLGTVSAGVFRSTDWGGTWEDVSEGLPINKPVNAMSFDGSHLLAALENGGVYLSLDRGTSWSCINSGLPDGINIQSLAIINDGVVAGTSGQSVWRRPLSDMIPTPSWQVVFPPDRGALAEMRFAFRWHPYFGALRYHIQSATDPQFQNDLLLNDSTTATDTLHASLIDAVDSTWITPSEGTWYWRLRAYTARGWSEWSPTWSYVFSTTGIKDLTSAPLSLRLEQNYPNPFNPRTVVSSQLAVVGNVRIVIYDMLGREVTTLVNERRAPGIYHDTFDASGLASGVYIYRMTAGSFTRARTMVLVR